MAFMRRICNSERETAGNASDVSIVTRELLNMYKGRRGEGSRARTSPNEPRCDSLPRSLANVVEKSSKVVGTSSKEKSKPLNHGRVRIY